MNQLLACLCLAFLVNVVTASQRFTPCDTPCETNGHVPTCCMNHGFADGGYCHNREAYCLPVVVISPPLPLPDPAQPPVKDWSEVIIRLQGLVRKLRRHDSEHTKTEESLRQMIANGNQTIAVELSILKADVSKLRSQIDQLTLKVKSQEPGLTGLRSAVDGNKKLHEDGDKSLRKLLKGHDASISNLESEVRDIQNRVKRLRNNSCCCCG